MTRQITYLNVNACSGGSVCVQCVRVCGGKESTGRGRDVIGIGEWEGLPLDDIQKTKAEKTCRTNETPPLGFYLCSVL